MITKLLGTPKQTTIDKIEHAKNKDFVKQLPQRSGTDFTKLFKDCKNADAIDLLQKMLKYDPDERITVEEALAHPYMKQLHFPDDEPTTELVSAFDFDFEKYSLSREDFKDLMFDEIALYHSDEAAKAYVAAKEKYPKGMLGSKYGERLRKAYKDAS